MFSQTPFGLFLPIFVNEMRKRQKNVILNYFLGIFLGPKTDFVVGFPVNAEQPA